MAKPIIRKSAIREMNFGENVVVVEPVNLYEATIGNECFIGPFTEIQKGVLIGDRCRIQSHSFICEQVTIGNDCFVGHGVVFINDDFRTGYPASRSGAELKQTVVGDRVSIGSNATILPVSICSDCVIGAGAVVTHDLMEQGFYVGNPARKLEK
jgi:acetyltransferase-like isoleucine patch superfamily enzyme